MSKVFRKITFLVLIIALFVFMGAACQCGGKKGKRNEEGKIELVYWRVNDDSRVFNNIIKQYQREHKNIKIEVVEKDKTTYESELVDALAAGTGPDIAQIRNDWLPKHWQKLVPATDNVGKLINEQNFKTFYVDVAAEELIKEGKVYGLPLSISTLALYYRKRDVNRYLSDNFILELPNNWTDLIPIVRGLTKKGKKGNILVSGLAMGTANNVPYAGEILQLLMMQNGTKMVADDLRGAAFNTSKRTAAGKIYYPGREALNFYTSFANPRHKNYSWNSQMGNALDAFVSGKTMMIFGYPEMISEIYSKAPTLNFNVMPFPQIKNSKTPKNYPYFWAETVTNNALARGNEEAAWEFLSYLAGFGDDPSGYIEYLNMANRPESTRKKFFGVKEEEYNRTRVLLGEKVFYEQAQTAVSWYKGKYPEKVDQVFYNMIEAVISHGQTLQSAIDTASVDVTSLLQE